MWVTMPNCLYFQKQKYGYSLMFFNYIILNFPLAYWQQRYNVNTFLKVLRNQDSVLESGMVVLIKQNWIAGMGPDSLLRQCQANVTSHTTQGCLLIYNMLNSSWQVAVKSSALKSSKGLLTPQESNILLKEILELGNWVHQERTWNLGQSSGLL